MTDESALLAAIRAAPADDAPRLVYADWLDEHGCPERAEFIRVQCEVARTGNPTLRRREAELLAAHHDAFAGPLAAPHLRFRFERGFVVGFGHTGVFGWRERTSIGGNPPELTGWLVMFRFHPTRQVEQAVVQFDSIQDAPQRFREITRNYFSNYTLDVHFSPPKLTFSKGVVTGTMKHRGRMKSTSLVLDESAPLHQPKRKEYVHYPIPGFDSFPET